MKTASATALRNLVCILVCTFALTPSAWATKSDLVRVVGATSSELDSAAVELHTAAYGREANKENGAPQESDGEVADELSETDVNTVTTENEGDKCVPEILPSRLQVEKKISQANLCLGRGTMLVADTDTDILYLCKDGQSVRDFDFAKGIRNTGKMKYRDLKTPLGEYPIGKMFASKKFKLFIPIGYPTAKQKAAGFTGYAIGLHGPQRWRRCAGFLNTFVDWTLGCLAMASDVDIKEIGRFVAANSVKKILILPVNEGDPSAATPRGH